MIWRNIFSVRVNFWCFHSVRRFDDLFCISDTFAHHISSFINGFTNSLQILKSSYYFNTSAVWYVSIIFSKYLVFTMYIVGYKIMELPPSLVPIWYFYNTFFLRRIQKYWNYHYLMLSITDLKVLKIPNAPSTHILW